MGRPVEIRKASTKSVKMEKAEEAQIGDDRRPPGYKDHLFLAAGNIACKIFEQGRTERSALELGSKSLWFGDHMVEYFESKEPLSEPLACKAGCHYCCFYQVWLTPPEALLIAHYTDKAYSRKEKADLMDRIEKVLERTEGKTVEERKQTRRDTPCIFLMGGQCSAYDVRPFVCRALHALNAGECKKAFESNSRKAEFEGYSYRYDIYQSVKAGLQEVCIGMGCQMDILPIARAIKQCLKRPGLGEAWIRGDKVFLPRGCGSQRRIITDDSEELEG